MMHFSLCASLSFCLSLGYTYAHTASVISAQSMPGASRTCCTFNGGLDQGRAGRCSCCLQRTTRPTATTNPQHCCAAVAHDGLDISKVHIDLWSTTVNDEVKRRCQGGGQKPSLTLSCACVIHDAIIMPSFPPLAPGQELSQSPLCHPHPAGGPSQPGQTPPSRTWHRHPRHQAGDRWG